MSGISAAAWIAIGAAALSVVALISFIFTLNEFVIASAVLQTSDNYTLRFVDGTLTVKKAALVITADEGLRGGRVIPLKANVDEALEQCTSVNRVIVMRRTDTDVSMTQGRDIWWQEACPPIARPRRWAPRTRCSSSIRPVRPGSPRA